MGISFGTVQSILTGILRLSKVSAGWVLRMLTDDQKRTQLDISRYLLGLAMKMILAILSSQL